MSTELPPGSDASADLARVHRTSLVRAVIVCAVWVGTLSLRHLGPSVRLGLDVILAIAGLWAAAPGRRTGSPLFGEHGHWTSLSAPSWAGGGSTPPDSRRYDSSRWKIPVWSSVC